MARSSIFTHGYVVGILVLSRGDSDDEGRLPDAVASPNKPTFTRLRDQYKLPLPAPESGAAGAFVSHAKITTAVIQSGPHVGQLTSDVDKAGAPLPTATPGVELVVGAYRVDLGLGYSPQTFEIEVTEEHTQAAPLDLYSAAPYVPGQGQPVTTVLLPVGASVGDVLTFGPDGVEWAAPTGGEGGTGGPVSWGDVTGKPAVIAAGPSATAARDAIGAGTSNLQIGTGPTTAAAGDHTHSQYATTTALTNGLAGKVAGVGISTVRALTQAQYDALTPDPATLYVITG